MNALIAGAFAALAFVGWSQAMKWRRAALTALGEARRWEGISESRSHQLGLWISRAYALGYMPNLTESQAKRVISDLFAPSTERDVEQQREWRKRRALLSRDHLTKHSVDATNDSEAATEIMVFCIGSIECEGE